MYGTCYINRVALPSVEWKCKTKLIQIKESKTDLVHPSIDRNIVNRVQSLYVVFVCACVCVCLRVSASVCVRPCVCIFVR